MCPVITPNVFPTPEHVQGGGGELHLRGLEERLPDHLHAGRQQRACGGRPGGPDDRHALGEWTAGWPGCRGGGRGPRCWLGKMPLDYMFKEELERTDISPRVLLLIL